MPRVITPKMSSRSARTAVSAPLRANTRVPVKSSANSSGVSVDMARGIPRPYRPRVGIGSRSENTMTDSSTAVEALLSGLSTIRDWQEDFYRDLHAHPELSHQEYETAAQSRRPAARLEL